MDAATRADIKMRDTQRGARHWPGTAKLQLRLYQALQTSSAAGTAGTQWAAAARTLGVVGYDVGYGTFCLRLKGWPQFKSMNFETFNLRRDGFVGNQLFIF